MKRYVVKVFLAGWLALLLLASSPFNPLSSRSAQAVTNARHGGEKVIVVDLTQEKLVAYEGKKEVYTTLVLSGRAGLETPTGTFHIFNKESPTTFYSPFPAGTDNWYPPTHIDHAMEFKSGGYYLHDSWWHTRYGPGTQGWHKDPVYGPQNGSHGCISMPASAASWLYGWAPLGTTVVIHT